ncbi:MAG: hypothetical protein ACLU37_00250 [Collinsella sp.]
MAIVLNLILPQTPVVAQHIDAAKDAAVDLVLPGAEVTNSVLFVGGRIASSADVMRQPSRTSKGLSLW